MALLNQVGCSRRQEDSPNNWSPFVVRTLSVLLRCFVGVLAILYAAKMAALLTVDQLLSDNVPGLVADEDDVISTVTGSDVSRLLSAAETPRQRQLWNAASRRSTVDYDRDQLVDDADVGFARLILGEIDAFVWHTAGLEQRAIARWGCGWQSERYMAFEDVGLLTFSIAVRRAVDGRQTTTRQLLNSALLRLERENFFEALHNKLVTRLPRRDTRRICSLNPHFNDLI